MLRITLGLAAWTLFIWANRLWNILESDESGLFWPISFMASAVALLVLLYIWSENMIRSTWFALAITAFGIASTLRWTWSLFESWTNDNSLAFRLVHTGIALVTAVLCFQAARLIWRIDSGEQKLEQLSG